LATDRDIAIGFLTRVLPAEGPYALRSPYKPGKAPNHVEWAGNVTELWDKMSQHGDVNCFYSTAAFKDDTSPDAANVRAKRTFYLDVEGDKEHFKNGAGYDGQTAAIKAVIEFCQAVNLPWPGFVLSGGGVHAYWPLDGDISPAVWQPYASGLKAACKEKKLIIDPAIPADAARILRCPGTFNCKREPKTEVTIHDVFFTLGPYSLDEFAPLLSYAPEVKGLPAVSPEARFEGSAALNDQTAAYYGDALASIPNDDSVPYDTWLKIGMAVFELGWGDVGRQMWHDWSIKAPKHKEEEFDNAWNGFLKYRETHLDNLVTSGSLIHFAKETGWTTPVGIAPPISATAPFVPPPELLQKAEKGDRYELHSARVNAQGPLMTGKDGSGFAENKWRNATWALVKLGVRGRWDEFSNNSEIKFPGRPWEQISSRTDSDARRMIMEVCCGSDQGKHAVEQALDELCGNVGRYHPIREHLHGLRAWDEKPRLDTWLIDYCHASDTPLNRFYGAAVLVAAVRRALTDRIIRFDHMLVLEGGTGIGKSSVVEILGRGAAPEGWYKNQEINWLDPRSSVEALRGAWFYEWPELKGHGKQAENHIKSCLSSPIDSIRMAYDRRVTSSPRRAILIATTNYGSEYLTDQTGNRRYWVVDCGSNKFRLDELRRERDQLFAEALVWEKEGRMGAYLDTPEELASAEKAELEPRTTVPHLVDFISPLTSGDVEFLTMHDVKTSTWMANQGAARDQDIAAALRWLGWEQDKYNNYKLPNGERTRRWRRVEA